ncbi:MAG: hypothetical protein JSS05_10885 [Proteobacteria bacterium]|nr:hypothetical protein [Pseudomonadota bacterium]
MGWITGAKRRGSINDSVTNYEEGRRVINGKDKKYEIAQLAQQYEDLLMSARLTPVVATE